ncbi:MAG: SLC13 family permease [Prevotellaceae bacterium]|nr:sodium:proton antiporter [Prevotella sp.]MDD7247845.1 SLC13 family permease [Prevotellaceae bacterium]MDY2749098.1 SLC13 family permease [Prevotella sp.]
MTYIIVAILIVSLFLIATERHTNINKAAVSVFACTLGWVLYVCFGSDFVASQHSAEYLSFLDGVKPNSTAVKMYIAQDILLPYIGHAAEIVLFLVATMSIVNILYNNGCFDFLTLWIRTRNSKLLLWKLTAVAFFMSANLDNTATIVIMLTVTNAILIRTKDRMIYGAMVMTAVSFGGALTVIGDPVGLVLWNKGAITATDYTLSMLLPCLIAWTLPTAYMTLRLPDTVEVERATLPYRGDDTTLNIWQRLLMFLVGIGGLWFIPTFHDITKLPPFLGALCVLSLLWIVNELFNRKIFRVERSLRSDIPQQMQYNTIQKILYIIGVILALGVVAETGAMNWLAHHVDRFVGNVWGIGATAALASTVLDNFASFMTLVSLHDVSATDAYYGVGGDYWKAVSFGGAVGGSILCIGSIAGVMMMRMQGVSLKWYIRNITPLTLTAGIIAFIVLCLQLQA